jgi:general secretion pathway protein F
VTFPLYRAELPANLSAEESAELAAHLAALAHSGLPLEGGLYALADEVARPRLARVLGNLAAQLERGEKLETAIAAQGSRLPAHLRGLIVAGVRSGRLPIVLDQFAALVRRQQDLRRRVILALAYPALLLGFMALLMVGCHLFIQQFAQIFRDFGTKLPAITDLFIRFSGLVAWIVLGLTIAAVLVPVAAMFLPLGAWLGRVALRIPIMGPIVRYDRHAQFSRLMAVLLEAEVPLPEALHLTSLGLQGTALARQCRSAAAAVEGGTPLDQALAAACFLDSLTVMVGWGQQKACLAEAFRAAAEAFESRTSSQTTLLNLVVLPVIYMIIVTFVGFVMLALLLPFISLISNLSGGK